MAADQRRCVDILREAVSWIDYIWMKYKIMERTFGLMSQWDIVLLITGSLAEVVLDNKLDLFVQYL